MFAMLIVVMLDGSVVCMKGDANMKLDVATKHGRLNIPINDVRRINFGCHAEDQAKMTSTMQQLGSSSYEARVAAEKYIKSDLRGAFKTLLAYKNSENQEIKNRVAGLLKLYGDAFPPITDNLTTSILKIDDYCEVLNKTFAGHSESLGDLVLRTSQIKYITVTPPAIKISLKATDGWMSLGHRYGPVSFTASGQIDLWPENANKYISSPNGMPTWPTGKFKTGALIGRVNGRNEFLIGERFHASDVNGVLEISVMPAPLDWGTAVPEGAYEVEIQ